MRGDAEQWRLAAVAPVRVCAPAGGPLTCCSDFANRAFASCTDANRQAVSDELKALIFRAFQDGTLYTTDWQNAKLSRCVECAHVSVLTVSLEPGGSKRAAASSKSYARAATGAGLGPRPPPGAAPVSYTHLRAHEM